MRVRGVCMPKPWNLALNWDSWDPKHKGTNLQGTNLKSLTCDLPHSTPTPRACAVIGGFVCLNPKP